MPRGDKTAYTSKQKRKAEHIEDGYRDRGLGKKESERRAWATVNKQDGGGKKAPSKKAPAAGRSKSSQKTASKGAAAKRTTRKTKSTGKARK